MKIQNAPIAALVLTACLSGTAQAALQFRLGGQAYYDTDLNVTWLADANLAATNTFDVWGIDLTGYMDWTTAQLWIGAMNSANYLGYSDWRLPVTNPINGSSMTYSLSNDGTTDYGYNISAPGTLYAGSKGSELAYLYANTLGNKAVVDFNGNVQVGWSLNPNPGPFSNLQSGYWSGTEYAPNPTVAWWFNFMYGNQTASLKLSSMYGGGGNYAWAVRTGDVAAVPEADTWAMLLAGLGLVSAAARLRRASGICAKPVV